MTILSLEVSSCVHSTIVSKGICCQLDEQESGSCQATLDHDIVTGLMSQLFI